MEPIKNLVVVDMRVEVVSIFVVDRIPNLYFKIVNLKLLSKCFYKKGKIYAVIEK